MENEKIVHCDYEEIYHWGILGQKWGVRRYQNEDGTLTAEGRKRYGIREDNIKEINKQKDKDDKDLIDAGSSIINNTDKLLSIGDSGDKVIRPSYDDLSDEELRKRVNRLNMERSYSQLVGDEKVIKSGKTKAREALQTIGSIVGIVGGAALVYKTIRGRQ